MFYLTPDEDILKTANLLSSFYQDRQVPYDVQLAFYIIGDGRGRLQPHGTELQEIRDDETKKRNLALYQAEFEDFTSFLKQEYFAE